MPVTLKPDGSYVFDTVEDVIEFRRLSEQNGQVNPGKIVPIGVAKERDVAQKIGGFLSQLNPRERKTIDALSSHEKVNTDELAELLEVKRHATGPALNALRRIAKRCGFPDDWLQKHTLPRKPKKPTVSEFSIEDGIREKLAAERKSDG